MYLKVHLKWLEKGKEVWILFDFSTMDNNHINYIEFESTDLEAKKDSIPKRFAGSLQIMANTIQLLNLVV